MSKPSLIVIPTTNLQSSAKKITLNGLSQRMQTQKATFERKWLVSPQGFLNTSSINQLRIKRTEELIKKWFSKKGKVLDMGCAYGELSIFSQSIGHDVVAVDIASNAIKHLDQLRSLGINTLVDQLPLTKLEDSSFEYLICADTIGELPVREYRLTLSELSRLLKKDGILICSTPLDRKTYLPHRTFLSLAKTEFEELDLVFSHHALHEAFTEALERLESFCKSWKALSNIIKKFRNIFISNKSIVFILEKLTKFIKGEGGITHLIYVGKRKSLFSSIDKP